ncbi:hypothetical protein NKJ70_30520 [Mesorhizobium sp. M0092]
MLEEFPKRNYRDTMGNHVDVPFGGDLEGEFVTVQGEVQPIWPAIMTDRDKKAAPDQMRHGKRTLPFDVFVASEGPPKCHLT